MTTPAKTPFLSDKSYQIMKWVAQIAIPAIGSLYLGLGQIWDFETAKVVASLTVLDTFLGILLGLSSISYNNSGAKYDGTIDIQKNEAAGTGNMSIQVDTDPVDLEKKKKATFKVGNNGPIVDLEAPADGD